MAGKPLLEDAFLMSLGLASMAKERAAEVLEYMVKEGRLAAKDQAKLQKRLVAQGEKEYQAMRRSYEASLGTALKALNVPTRKEFEALKKKVEKRRK